MERTFTCTCKKTVSIPHDGNGSYNIGEMQNKTGGWKFIPLYDGAASWLCPECYTKAKNLAKELVSIVGTIDFTIGTFVREKKQNI